MGTPHRRDISARQDVLGRELRQLFDDFTQEEVPDELMRLAEQLQGAMERQGTASAPEPVEGEATAPAEAADQMEGVGPRDGR